jgi:hypothetical protein
MSTPMTLGNMRANGVGSLDVSCWQRRSGRAGCRVESGHRADMKTKERRGPS